VTSHAKMELCVWMKSIGTIHFHVSILVFFYIRSHFRKKLIIFKIIPSKAVYLNEFISYGKK